MQSTEVAQIGPGPLKALSFQVVYSVLENFSVLYFEETNRFLVGAGAPVSRVLLSSPPSPESTSPKQCLCSNSQTNVTSKLPFQCPTGKATAQRQPKMTAKAILPIPRGRGTSKRRMAVMRPRKIQGKNDAHRHLVFISEQMPCPCLISRATRRRKKFV